jgi:hypothetical protein
MAGLNDLFKVIAEGKKDYEETDPKGILQKQIREEVKVQSKLGLADLMRELASLKEQSEKIDNGEQITIVENPDIWNNIYEQDDGPLSDEQIKQINEIANVGEVTTKSKLFEPEPIKEDMGWGSNDIDKYVKSDAFKKAKPVTQKVIESNPEVGTLKEKIKFLEQWVSRIASAGPGSGEVNFRYLDDVDRSTMNPGNDNWVLEYNSANGHVQFTEDVGPIRTIKLNTSGPILNGVPGMLAWNSIEDCLDVYQADGTVWQGGLENYIQVYNESGSKLTNGTVVRFSGVHNSVFNEPTVEPHIANGTIPPLYTVGVITTDIENDAQGRATVFGKVRGVNTTGSDVGETWNIGELLYVSTQYPGKYTKVKPTAPNIVIYMAAVLKVDSNNGILLVRPTIYPRLYYGDFSSTVDQLANTTSIPWPMTVNTTNIANGFYTANTSATGTGNTRFVAQNSGLYNVQFSAQLVSTNSSTKNIWIWPRKNGVDIPNSATRISVSGSNQYIVPAWNWPISLNVGEYFEIFWAVDDIGVRMDAPPAQAFCPAIPSLIVTVSEIAL